MQMGLVNKTYWKFDQSKKIIRIWNRYCILLLLQYLWSMRMQSTSIKRGKSWPTGMQSTSGLQGESAVRRLCLTHIFFCAQKGCMRWRYWKTINFSLSVKEKSQCFGELVAYVFPQAGQTKYFDGKLFKVLLLISPKACSKKNLCFSSVFIAKVKLK